MQNGHFKAGAVGLANLEEPVPLEIVAKESYKEIPLRRIKRGQKVTKEGSLQKRGCFHSVSPVWL